MSTPFCTFYKKYFVKCMGSRAPGISGTRRSCPHLVDPAPPYKNVCARANTPDKAILLNHIKGCIMEFKLVELASGKIAGYVSAPSWEEAEIFLMGQFDMYISEIYKEYDLVQIK